MSIDPVDKFFHRHDICTRKSASPVALGKGEDRVGVFVVLQRLGHRLRLVVLLGFFKHGDDFESSRGDVSLESFQGGASGVVEINDVADVVEEAGGEEFFVVGIDFEAEMEGLERMVLEVAFGVLDGIWEDGSEAFEEHKGVAVVVGVVVGFGFFVGVGKDGFKLISAGQEVELLFDFGASREVSPFETSVRNPA